MNAQVGKGRPAESFEDPVLAFLNEIDGEVEEGGRDDTDGDEARQHWRMCFERSGLTVVHEVERLVAE